MMGSSCLCLPQVDYSTVFVFRLLMFVDNGLASGMGLDLGWQQRYARFCGRIVVLSVLALLLYPLLWAWTVIGTLWFTSARNCLPEEGQKWVSLFGCFSAIADFCALLVSVSERDSLKLTIISLSLILHKQTWTASEGKAEVILLSKHTGNLVTFRENKELTSWNSYSLIQVFVDLVRVPDWAFEAAGQEMRVMGLDAAQYQPGLYLTPAQREAVEALIHELPKFRLKAVPTDCSPGLPCAHNFHVECIDEWLRLNVKCPRCRCSVFPNLDLSALSTIRVDSERSTNVVTTTARYIRNQPPSQSYLLRLQGLLLPVHTVSAGSGSEMGSAETAASRGPMANDMETVQVVVQESLPPQT
ncbi:UNVERIFIED_CONTAM: E3 ubiquitin-protein ligase SIS3 [Sesamum latifolium]|uniref:E3 ubiquitin-protein ligase SIS3 n=1 Tax=Sesamum latifolium TaxID=2727402 RepID=A0AAW2UWI3_9LAMI